MKTLLLAAAIAALSGCCHADAWRPHQIALESAFLVADYIDMRQTEHVVSRGTESNPLIGRHGQYIPPVVWFPVTAVLHLAIMHFLPSVHRSWALGASAGFEWSTVQTNYYLGDGMW